MKKQFLLFSLVLHSIGISENIQVPQTTAPVTININNNQYSTTTQNQMNTNTNTNITSVTTQIKTSVMSVLSAAQKMGKKHSKTLLDFILKNKKRVIGGSILSLYILTCAYLFHLHSFLQKTDAWHAWKYELSNQELTFADGATLAHSLLISLQEKYFNHHRPTNNLFPLVQFYMDLSLEEKKIERYILLSSLITSCYLSYFFPITKKRVLKAKMKKQRIQFLKKLFVTHMATQNSLAITRAYLMRKLHVAL